MEDLEKTGKVVAYEDGQGVLMHGEPVGPNFPWGMYEAKYERRQGDEADDREAAPASFTNFVWPDLPAESLTWQVLKTVWNAERIECPNCDVPILLLAFSWRTGMLSFRSGRADRVCLGCRRRFLAAGEEPLAWLAKVLPPHLLPTHLRLWDAIPIDWQRLCLGHAQAVQLGVGEG